MSPESLETVKAFVERGTGRDHSAMGAAVERWRNGPDDPRFGLFFFDDLKTDAAGLRRRILTFIGGDPGVESAGLPADHNRKAAYAKIPMSLAVRDYLAAEFAGEIRFAATETGRPGQGLGGEVRGVGEWPGGKRTSLTVIPAEEVVRNQDAPPVGHGGSD